MVVLLLMCVSILRRFENLSNAVFGVVVLKKEKSSGIELRSQICLLACLLTRCVTNSRPTPKSPEMLDV